MLIEVEKTYKQADIRHELSALMEKHGVIENLQRKATANKCGTPNSVDDLVLWRAMDSSDVVLTEKILINSPKVFADLTPRRMDLLEYVQTNSVGSIKELANCLGRNYKNVYDDIRALEKWGLVTLTRNGKSRKAVCQVKSLKVLFRR